ncbi:condensation domain-containing protein [Frankia sp. CiP3]|uniref:condensation domain-containing protein n=1 Tax=Frankia sp. CiP3 TaxID=2880971 RepID=UPI001EF4A53D|nr:condensation domain-containing protein [Frankia sp. CiP3]
MRVGCAVGTFHRWAVFRAGQAGKPKEGVSIDSRAMRRPTSLPESVVPPLPHPRSGSLLSHSLGLFATGEARAGSADRVRERPFSVLEDLIMASDRRSAPISLGMIARTRAAIDPESLRAAVHSVLARHPMARARLRTGPSGRRWWFPDASTDDAAVATVAVLTGDDGDDVWAQFADLCSRPFDLAAAPPLRVLHMRLPGGDAVALAAHHVALDGLSVATLLRAILELSAPSSDVPEMAPQAGGPTAKAAERAVANPVRPADCRPAAAGPGRPARGRLPDLAVPRQWLPGRVAVTAARRTRHDRALAERHHPTYGVHSETLPVPKPRQPTCGGSAATVNDLLLAAAQAAVERWNSAAGRATGTLRMRMPINIRERDGDVALGNHTGEAVIATTSRERQRPDILLAAVRRQTVASKAADRPAGARVPTGVVASLPGPVRHALLRVAVALARPLLMPAASVTNLGRMPDLPAAGTAGPQVTSFHFAAFAGMPQGLVITAVGYGDELYLTFCYHRDLFDLYAVRRFAALYRTALGELS